MKRQVVRKTFLLDPARVSRAKKVLGAASETEAVRMALDKVIDEDRDERKRLKAHREFLKILDSEESNRSTVVEKEPASEARPRFKSRALAELHENVSDLYRLDMIDEKTMRKLDRACLMASKK
jgi:hypothetical protein